jgi:hypothetical protein
MVRPVFLLYVMPAQASIQYHCFVRGVRPRAPRNSRCHSREGEKPGLYFHRAVRYPHLIGAPGTETRRHNHLKDRF